MLVRLLTENKNYPEICKIVSKYFGGFTIIKADGYWQGNAEHSLIIEIDANVTDADVTATAVAVYGIEQKIKQLVYAIKQLNKQDKMLVQYIKSESKLL